MTELDERLVTDKDFYEELLIVESELIDDYLSGDLSATERQKFETHFLIAPERQAQLRFARSFHTYLEDKAPAPDPEPSVEPATEQNRDVPKPPPKPWYSTFLPIRNPALTYSFMVALVLIVAGAGWYAFRNSSSDSGPVYVAELMPGGPDRSGGKENKIVLPPGTGALELRLAVGADAYQSYRAVLVGDSGSEVWQKESLQSTDNAGRRVVVLKIPVRSLIPGSYKLKLSGQLANGAFEDLPSYNFLIPR
jgi:hypothetical protein